MPSNTGFIDALSRACVALGLFALSVLFRDAFLVSLSVALAAIVLLITALTRTCPVYRLFGINTRQGRFRDWRRRKDHDGQRAAIPASGAPLGVHPGTQQRH